MEMAEQQPKLLKNLVQMFSSQMLCFPQGNSFTWRRSQEMGLFHADSTEDVQGVVIAKNGMGRQRETILSGPSFAMLSEGS